MTGPKGSAHACCRRQFGRPLGPRQVPKGKGGDGGHTKVWSIGERSVGRVGHCQRLHPKLCRGIQQFERTGRSHTEREMAADVEWNVSHCAANMMVQLPIDTQALCHIFVWYFFYSNYALNEWSGPAKTGAHCIGENLARSAIFGSGKIL